MTAAADLSDGCWLARWAQWEVRLEAHSGRWSVALTVRARDGQTERLAVVAEHSDFGSAADAAQWAAKELNARGQIVLLLSSDGRPPMRLVDMLSFEPAG